MPSVAHDIRTEGKNGFESAHISLKVWTQQGLRSGGSSFLLLLLVVHLVMGSTLVAMASNLLGSSYRQEGQLKGP